MTQNRDYLGDSVYADFDGFNIILTTENGMGASNTIILEPKVMDALSKYRNRIIADNSKETNLDTSNRLAASVLEGAKNFENAADNMRKVLQEVNHVLPLLSDTAEINAYGGAVWFTVKNREDVKTLMQLSPKWTKSSDERGINYESVNDFGHFRIQTRESALPPTCQLVEEDVVIPAQPEKTVKKTVVRCISKDISEDINT